MEVPIFFSCPEHGLREERQLEKENNYMLPSIKKILYATDLSKNSAYAFRYAVKLAGLSDAKITILYTLPAIDAAMIVPTIVQLGNERYDKLREEQSREMIQKIKEKLQEFTEEELKDDKEKIRHVSAILVHEGDPVDEILTTSDRLDSDMIILGAHGKGVLTHTFLGTVPDKVLRRSRKPVLIVPIPKDARDIDL
jgi:nucleotide-binding universal stress UspA family protein